MTDSTDLLFPDDKRKYDRLKLSAKITYTSETAEEKNGTVLSTNVSGRGLSFALDEALPEGANLSLRLKLPDMDTPVTATGVVIWCKEKVSTNKQYRFEVGISLTVIDNQDRYFQYICEHLLLTCIDSHGKIKGYTRC